MTTIPFLFFLENQFDVFSLLSTAMLQTAINSSDKISESIYLRISDNQFSRNIILIKNIILITPVLVLFLLLNNLTRKLYGKKSKKVKIISPKKTYIIWAIFLLEFILIFYELSKDIFIQRAQNYYQHLVIICEDDPAHKQHISSYKKDFVLISKESDYISLVDTMETCNDAERLKENKQIRRPIILNSYFTR